MIYEKLRLDKFKIYDEFLRVFDAVLDSKYLEYADLILLSYSAFF